MFTTKLNRRFYKYLFAVFFFLIVIFISAQQDANSNSLRKRIQQSEALFYSDSERWNEEWKSLIEEARETDDKYSELILLSNKVWFFLRKANFDNVINSAKELEKKSIEYQNINFQGVAHIYLLEVYAQNKLYDKALDEYDTSIKILNKGNPEDNLIIRSKANAHTYISNLYHKKKDYKEAINKLLLAEKEYQNISDSKLKLNGLCLNYRNIADVYLEYNLDSAEYFIQKSIKLIPENDQKQFLAFLNYSMLGNIHLKRKHYKEALTAFEKAELIKPEGGDPVNLEELYQGMIEVHEALGNTSESQSYQLKLNKIQLEISENKNSSLHSVIKNSSEENTKLNQRTKYIIIFSVLVLIILFVLYVSQKNRYKPLEGGIDPQPLIQLIKNNDPGFIFAFDQTFPEFTKKISLINSDLSKTEIEFCALLKLNLSTKEIARIKMISPKSVHNSKYRIRKKLNISPEEDIYKWFSKI